MNRKGKKFARGKNVCTERKPFVLIISIFDSDIRKNCDELLVVVFARNGM